MVDTTSQHIKFSPFPELKTQRLLFRKPRHDDAPVIFFLRTDEAVNEYIKRSQPSSLADAEKFIEDVVQKIDRDESIVWCICLLETEEMIGTICLWHFSEDASTAEVGYDLHPDHHGRGIMTEALRAVLGFGFGTLKLSMIEAFTHKKNGPSTRLLERNHFCLMPHRRDEDNADNAIFEINKRLNPGKEEWSKDF